MNKRQPENSTVYDFTPRECVPNAAPKFRCWASRYQCSHTPRARALYHPRTSRVPRGHALHTVPLSSWRLRSASSPPLARVTAWGGERRGAASVTEGARQPSTPFRQSRLVALGSRALRVVGHGEPLLQLRVRLLDDGCAGRARESGGAGHARASASAPRDRGAAARAGEQGGRTMPRAAQGASVGRTEAVDHPVVLVLILRDEALRRDHEGAIEAAAVGRH